MATETKRDEKFRINPSNILGFEYGTFTSQMRALSLSKPALYFQLRADVLKSVKEDAIGNLYDTIFNVLSVGETLDNKMIGSTECHLGGRNGYKPKFPENKINDAAMTICHEMADHLNSIVNLLLPDDLTKISASQMTLKGRASVIE